MGIYLNPGNENFTDNVLSGMYVDKTRMIEITNHFIDILQKYICISRPRRFGKTVAGNMLSAYYSKGCNSAQLFSPYKIAKAPGFREKLNGFADVVFIPFYEGDPAMIIQVCIFFCHLLLLVNSFLYFFLWKVRKVALNVDIP